MTHKHVYVVYKFINTLNVKCVPGLPKTVSHPRCPEMPFLRCPPFCFSLSRLVFIWLESRARHPRHPTNVYLSCTMIKLTGEQIGCMLLCGINTFKTWTRSRGILFKRSYSYLTESQRTEWRFRFSLVWLVSPWNLLEVQSLKIAFDLFSYPVRIPS